MAVVTLGTRGNIVEPPTALVRTADIVHVMALRSLFPDWHFPKFDFARRGRVQWYIEIDVVKVRYVHVLMMLFLLPIIVAVVNVVDIPDNNETNN